MVLDLFLLSVFQAPSYCSFTSNITTRFTKKFLNPKYPTSTLIVLQIKYAPYVFQNMCILFAGFSNQILYF